MLFPRPLCGAVTDRDAIRSHHGSGSPTDGDAETRSYK